MIHETPKVLEDTYHETIREFSRQPESLNDAWAKVKQEVTSLPFDGTNMSLQDIAKVSALGTFMQQLAIGASSQGIGT